MTRVINFAEACLEIAQAMGWKKAPREPMPEGLDWDGYPTGDPAFRCDNGCDIGEICDDDCHDVDPRFQWISPYGGRCADTPDFVHDPRAADKLAMWIISPEGGSWRINMEHDRYGSSVWLYRGHERMKRPPTGWVDADDVNHAPLRYRKALVIACHQALAFGPYQET